MSRNVILPLAAGALLSMGCSKREPGPMATNPPPLEAGGDLNPPTTDSTLPTWDAVESGHPPGATNPPFPVLVIEPDGTCHKRWQSPFAARDGANFEPHVREDCAAPEQECGVVVQCPPEAAGVLAAWKASKEAN